MVEQALKISLALSAEQRYNFLPRLAAVRDLGHD
jgi:hypothetical protein